MKLNIPNKKQRQQSNQIQNTRKQNILFEYTLQHKKKKKNIHMTIHSHTKQKINHKICININLKLIIIN